LPRRLISRGGCLYARLILGVRGRDLTDGFKGIHRRVREAKDPHGISAGGSVFQTEVTNRAVLPGLRVRDPDHLLESRGRNAQDVGPNRLEAIWLIPRLRRALSRQAPSGLRRRGSAG
jgi:dolichol-phosphate mannosyltransferase